MWTRALRPPRGLRLASAAGLLAWMAVAAFPLAWIAVMSVKLPLDAFSSNPLDVLLGPETRARNGGVSLLGLLGAVALAMAAWASLRRRARLRPAAVPPAAGAAAVFLAALLLAATLGGLGRPVFGWTWEHYRAVWVEGGFHRQFVNSMVITFGVVAVSLTVGTLAGYGFARTRTRLAFWLLMAALVFRAMPHSVLVAGYLPVFIDSRQILAPLWDGAWTGPVLHLVADHAPTLYGQPLAVIAVLVAINQPFTIWMLRSFFASIPAELDEAARVDGCTHLEAFRRVIVPVMWPGIVTTGLFSFLLAYNDYLVTALLLDARSLTMVPAIGQFLASENNATEQLHAIAAAVSITAPLFLLVMVFQRNLVGGLTQGAVKG